jgi:hypothetical protein
MEIEDIEQELMCEVLECLHKFDEQRGLLEHFIRKVLARRSVNLLQSSLCAKRGPFVNFRECNENDCDEFASNDRSTEINLLSDYLPNRYKILCKLLADHSVTETSKIIGKSRAFVYRDLKRISMLVNQKTNFENHFLSMFRSGVNMKNLSILEKSSAKEISELEICDLMDLNDQVAKLISHTKELKEKLEDGLNLRFSESVKNNLRSENKDTGTTRFFDGAFQIVAEIPKKVTWDAEKMEQIIKEIPEEKRKSIVKISYVIEERKYSALPIPYKELFREARTVTPGKTKFQIMIGENQ